MLAQRLATPEQVEYATHVTPCKAPLQIPSPQPTAAEAFTPSRTAAFDPTAAEPPWLWR
jgi:hypothetical protein